MNGLERHFYGSQESGGMCFSQAHYGRILNPGDDFLTLLQYTQIINFSKSSVQSLSIV